MPSTRSLIPVLLPRQSIRATQGYVGVEPRHGLMAGS